MPFFPPQKNQTDLLISTTNGGLFFFVFFLRIFISTCDGCTWTFCINQIHRFMMSSSIYVALRGLYTCPPSYDKRTNWWWWYRRVWWKESAWWCDPVLLMMDDGRSTRGYASIGAVGGYARDSPSIAIEADVIAFFFFLDHCPFFF